MTPRLESASKHLSTFELDLLETGTLDENRTERLHEHLSACETCRAQRSELQAARSEFTNDVFPKTAHSFRQRSERVPIPRYRRAVVWAPVLASAAALLLVLGVVNTRRAPSDPAPELQAKGGGGLSLVVRRNGETLRPSDDAVELRAGDELRFVVFPTGDRAKHLLVASVDGSGKANVYFPFGGDRSGTVERLPRWEVPGSVILDDAPGPERIFALFSAEPMDARGVREQLARVGAGGWNAVRTTARLELPGVEQHSVLIEKGPRRPPP
jgi:hypothetical protein